MTSANPCAVYNFYNCCECNGSRATGTGSSSLFIWQPLQMVDPQAPSPGGGSVEPLAPVGVIGTPPNAALKGYLGLAPLHRKAQLKDIELIRFKEQAYGGSYNPSINFDLVVLGYSGAFIRKISAVTLNYTLLPMATWTPITLSTAPGVLDIMPGEVVAGQLTYGTAPPTDASYYAMFHMSGTGVLTP